jgi:iron-sulfur cluster insertion protein
MFSVNIPEEMLERLRSMLEDEDEGTCVRLREYKCGGGCSSKIKLGLGLDEPDEDEDKAVTVGDLPFIANEDFLLKYGKMYSVAFDDNKEVVVTAEEF